MLFFTYPDGQKKPFDQFNYRIRKDINATLLRFLNRGNWELGHEICLPLMNLSEIRTLTNTIVNIASPDKKISIAYGNPEKGIYTFTIE